VKHFRISVSWVVGPGEASTTLPPPSERPQSLALAVAAFFSGRLYLLGGSAGRQRGFLSLLRCRLFIFVWDRLQACFDTKSRGCAFDAPASRRRAGRGLYSRLLFEPDLPLNA